MNQIPHATPGLLCPMLRKDVSKVCHKCAWWTGLTWKDAHGESHHNWRCAMVMNAITNVDIVKATTGAQAATESMRNEVVARSGVMPLGAMTDHVLDAPRLGPETARGGQIVNGATPKLIGQG